jgi:hypothetical protein
MNWLFRHQKNNLFNFNEVLLTACVLILKFPL